MKRRAFAKLVTLGYPGSPRAEAQRLAYVREMKEQELARTRPRKAVSV